MEYVPKAGIAFVLSYPVFREVVAADFGERVVQHWVMARVMPLMEKHSFDENQFSCRIGKGNLAALDTLRDLIAEASERFTRPAVVAKFDMAGFFYSIDKRILYQELVRLIREHYKGRYMDILLYLVRVLTFTQPQEHAERRSPVTFWANVKGKSLYRLDWFLGLAIGNLFSQGDANFYNAPAMRWLRSVGVVAVNYVDDFACVFRSAEDYRRAMPHIADYFKRERGLTVHPRKHYCQPYGHGVKMLGGVVKYERIYISNRIVAKFENKIHWYNETCGGRYLRQCRQAERFASVINSYLGLMIHFAAYNIRKREAEAILPVWGRFLRFTDDYSKAVVKEKYNSRRRALNHARKVRRNDLSTINREHYECTGRTQRAA